MSGTGEEKEYLVRGAMIGCSMGSHPRRLNLPQSHGVYLLGKPMIEKGDCKPEKNVTYFGVCNSQSPPADAVEVKLAGFVPEGETVSVPDVQGMKCTPAIIGEWNNVHGMAVTTDSYLVCSCGGIIEPITSGQEYED